MATARYTTFGSFKDSSSTFGLESVLQMVRLEARINTAYRPRQSRSNTVHATLGCDLDDLILERQIQSIHHCFAVSRIYVNLPRWKIHTTFRSCIISMLRSSCNSSFHNMAMTKEGYLPNLPALLPMNTTEALSFTLFGASCNPRRYSRVTRNGEVRLISIVDLHWSSDICTRGLSSTTKTAWLTIMI